MTFWKLLWKISHAKKTLCSIQTPVHKAIPRKQGQWRNDLRTQHLSSILTAKGREKVPQDQWVWTILELEASTATQKLNWRAPSGFWQKKPLVYFKRFWVFLKNQIYLFALPQRASEENWKCAWCWIKSQQNLQSKWMGQTYPSFTNVKLKPQITLKAHDRAQHSIYIPEPDLMPYLQISLSFNCANLLYNLPHLQRLLKLMTESKNSHSLKHEIVEQAMLSCVQRRFLQPNFCWSSSVKEFLLTKVPAMAYSQPRETKQHSAGWGWHKTNVTTTVCRYIKTGPHLDNLSYKNEWSWTEISSLWEN